MLINLKFKMLSQDVKAFALPNRTFRVKVQVTKVFPGDTKSMYIRVKRGVYAYKLKLRLKVQLNNIQQFRFTVILCAK